MTSITKQQAKKLREFIEYDRQEKKKASQGLDAIFDGHKEWCGPSVFEVIKILNEPVHRELSYILFEEGGYVKIGDKEIDGLTKDLDSFIRLLEFSGLLKDDE